MTVLAVAAVSARVLAEAASADGFDVVALDVFGDADTRRACSQWLPIGAAGSMQFDATRLLWSLGMLARRGDVAGWIAGSGFEGRPELLQRGAALLPLIGTAADAVRRVRDPRLFFAVLDAEGIPHPPVQMTPPSSGAGWLVKDAHGCGGWQICRAGLRPEAVAAHHYFQREVQGTPMSATFVANGTDACVLGFNQLTVRRFGTRPFVYCGVIGPVPLAAAVAGRITAAVRTLAAVFSLRGLGSLDFMLDGDGFGVLEINPRPAASMALYGKSCFHGATRGLVAAHVHACLEGALPTLAKPSAKDTLRGSEIIFARRAILLDETAAQRLAEYGCHDLPAAGTRFAAADPLCSVSATGATGVTGATGDSAAQLRLALDHAREAVHQLLETPP